MRLAVFANHGKTHFFSAVQGHLERLGHDIYWISPGKRLSERLRGRTPDVSRVLDITALSSQWSRSHGDLEQWRVPLAGPMSLNAMILADRYLREKPYRVAIRYLHAVGLAAREFVEQNQIDAILGEQTYAAELVTAAATEHLGIGYFVPATVRIPSNRFGLFRGPLQVRLATDRVPTPTDVEAATALLAAFRREPERPYYFARNQGGVRPELSWLLSPVKQLLLQLRDPHEMNRPRLSWLLRTRASQVVNGARARRYPFASAEAASSLSPYVLLTLHRQPEASIDVLGYKVADQLQLIRTVAGDLPPGWRLLVKEHSNGLGDRGPSFYRQADRVPGVTLVDPWSDSRKLAAQAELTLTVSGTIAYEAGLLGYPAATLAPMYFGELLMASGANPYGPELADLLGRLSRHEVRAPSDADIVRFLAHTLANSTPGLIGAPDDTPESMANSNVQAVAAGIDTLLAD